MDAGCGKVVQRMTAPQTTILRLYSKVLTQAGSNFSQSYMEDTLAVHAGIARRLVVLFEHRFNPVPPKEGSLSAVAELQATTSSFAPRSSRNRTSCSIRGRSHSPALLPYGNPAVSPR